jgi:hypothetical protein
MIRYCCFIWTQGPILKPAIFWPKFGSEEDWVCQLLMEYVNDKSAGSQEKIQYALCWRQGPVVLFPLKLGKGDTIEPRETSSKWDPLSYLPLPYNPEALASQVESQDQDEDSSQEAQEAQPEFPSEPPIISFDP